MPSVRQLALRAITALLAKYDYDVKLRDAPVRGFTSFLEFARRCGVAPRTVFDVGVGLGTPWLYGAFPSAKLVLIEALETFRATVEELARRHDADYVITALGAEPGRLTMRVPMIAATSASMLARDPELERLMVGAARTIEDEICEVAVATLDSIAHRWEPPYFLKLDVEGAELAVLRGALDVLSKTDLVLMEMSVLPRFVGEPSFAERIAFMDQAGFRLFDIPEMSQTSTNGPLSNIDAAFVRKHNKLRIPAW